jgi:hypothetical protein
MRPRSAATARAATARSTYAGSGARAGLAGAALDLGTVEAHAKGSEDGVSVDLGNHGGDVAIAGVFRITPQAYALDARLTPATTLAPALALLVRSLGTPAPDGASA